MNKLAPYVQPLFPSPMPRRAQGYDLELDVWLTFEEAALGCQKILTYRQPGACTRCHQTGFEPGSPGHPCSRCRGEKLEYRPTEVVAFIPGGLDAGERVRLTGYGAPGGDLLLVSHVWPHRYFRREGFDVCLDVIINVAQAMLGVVAEVPTLYGPQPLIIPAGHPAGVPLCLPRLGIPHPQGGRGDQWIVPHVQIPVRLTRHQRALFAQLGATFSNPYALPL